jgi:hypothetical protein
MATYSNCFQILAQCPVTSTAYGHTLSLPANATLLGTFSLFIAVQVLQGATWKVWGFMIAFVLRSVFEVISKFGFHSLNANVNCLKGYTRRVILYFNLWSRNGYIHSLVHSPHPSLLRLSSLLIQMLFLTISPIFYYASIYLCYLKL